MRRISTNSVLAHLAETPSSGLTSLQNQADQLTGQFLEQASDWKSLAAMMAGGLAYRLGKIGMMSIGAGHVTAMPLRTLSVAFGLGSEVTAYEFTNRALQTVGANLVFTLNQGRSQGSPLQHPSPNLWSFSGPGGWKQGWLSSLITFGTLKGFGKLAEGQNLILQHASQSLGMVVGHQLLYRAGIGEKPEGIIAEQLVHAEATNLQLGAGMALGHYLTEGRLLALERGLDLAVTNSRAHDRAPLQTEDWAVARAGNNMANPVGPIRESSLRNIKINLNILLSTSEKNGPKLHNADPIRTGSMSPEKKEHPKEATEEIPSSKIPLREYQKSILSQLESDVKNKISPWLGIASPMQTGKSLLIGPIIERIEGILGKCQVVILGSGRAIVAQIWDDLNPIYPPEELGKFDGKLKDPRRITVASTFALARHLSDFPRSEKPLLIINDEAYSTQTPTNLKIYTYFGLGKEDPQGKETILVPQTGPGLVVGLSGTGRGLEGYHLTGQLGLLDGIEGGWVRPMTGERVKVQISSEKREGSFEGKMIWWTPTEENAVYLAELYGDKIHSRFQSSLVFVPTIKHGRLLLEAFQKRFGKNYPKFVHSGDENEEMDDDKFHKTIRSWQKKGGALISVRMLSRGFRATGTDAVFHTYQTTSPELFSQRTGRAWGVAEGTPKQDLYVLEVAWDTRDAFANLARLLGLVDYPLRPFNTQDLRQTIRAIERRKIREKEVGQKIVEGKILPLFEKIPLVEGWRTAMGQALQRAGGVAALAGQTGLPEAILSGFLLGGLPTQLKEVLPLQEHLGGRDKALLLWTHSWEEVVNDLIEGRRSSAPDLNRLNAWREKVGNWEEKAKALDEILPKIFHPDPGYLRTGNRSWSLNPKEISAFTEALKTFQDWEHLSPQERVSVEGGLQKIIKFKNLFEALGRGQIGYAYWPEVCRTLLNYFHDQSQEPKLDADQREQAAHLLGKIMGALFHREGWPTLHRTAQEHLLFEARRAFLVKYGRNVEQKNFESATLARWLKGEPVTYGDDFSPFQFYDELREFLTDLGMKTRFLNSLISEAALEESIDFESPHPLPDARTPEEVINSNLTIIAIHRLLATLTPREEKVLRGRFGIGAEEKNLKELAADYEVVRERIRQIEMKGLRKMRHPSRSARLKPYLETTPDRLDWSSQVSMISGKTEGPSLPVDLLLNMNFLSKPIEDLGLPDTISKLLREKGVHTIIHLGDGVKLSEADTKTIQKILGRCGLSLQILKRWREALSLSVDLSAVAWWIRDHLSAYTILDVMQKTEKEILKLPYFGRRQLPKLREQLPAFGMQLKEDPTMKFDGFSSFPNIPLWFWNIWEIQQKLDIHLTESTLDILKNEGVGWLKDLVQLTEEDFLKYGERGAGSLQEVEKVLADLDMQLGRHY